MIRRSAHHRVGFTSDSGSASRLASDLDVQAPAFAPRWRGRTQMPVKTATTSANRPKTRVLRSAPRRCNQRSQAVPTRSCPVQRRSWPVSRRSYPVLSGPKAVSSGPKTVPIRSKGGPKTVLPGLKAVLPGLKRSRSIPRIRFYIKEKWSSAPFSPEVSLGALRPSATPRSEHTAPDKPAGYLRPVVLTMPVHETESPRPVVGPLEGRASGGFLALGGSEHVL
jgi:hypothetical protein